jgi:sugar phosphate isomerase/epimerase
VKLCVPSYLFPGTWLENLEALVDREWIGGVELLFFAYDEEARVILARERRGIADLAGRFELSLHLPDPLVAGDEALVESTREFVKLYVLHPPSSGVAAWAGLVEAWRRRYGDVFHLEYTGAELFAAGEAALPGLPLCADTGRLLKDGLSPLAWIRERSDRLGEIHLHSLAGSRDHMSLRADEAWLGELCPFLRGFSGRVELELFSLEAALASQAALVQALAQASERARATAASSGAGQ